MMEIFRLIDEIELLIKESKKFPFSNGKVIVESSRFLDRLDRIRAILPEEFEEAKQLLEQKETIVMSACAEADSYLEASKDKVARLLDQNEITQNAMNVADDIINKSKKVAAEIKKDADDYAEEVLTHMEMVLKRGLEAVIQGKEALRSNDIEES